MRTPEIFHVKSFRQVNDGPLFHSDTVKLLHIISKWGYYTLQVPYKIGKQDALYKISTSTIQMVLCGVIQVVTLVCNLLITWKQLSLRELTISEDPFSWFCILKDILPNFSLGTYLYTVWMKPKGLKFLYQESCGFLDSSKKGSTLSWRQTLFLSLAFVLLYGPVYALGISGLVNSIVQGYFVKWLKGPGSFFGVSSGIQYIPVHILLQLYILYWTTMLYTTFFGVALLGCLLVSEVGNEVAAHLKDAGKFKNVQDITEFYVTVKTLLDAINEALSTLMGATFVNVSIFFGILLFTLFDSPEVSFKIVVFVAIGMAMLSLQAGAKGYDMMNGGIRNFIFKNRGTWPAGAGTADLLSLEQMIENEPLALYAGTFPLTHGLLISIISTSVTNFLIMLQFMGKKTKCRVI